MLLTLKSTSQAPLQAQLLKNMSAELITKTATTMKALLISPTGLLKACLA